jgi:hypothetical protein
MLTVVLLIVEPDRNKTLQFLYALDVELARFCPFGR